MSNLQTQKWDSLPEATKRAAAPDLIAGKVWIYWGKQVEFPGEEELSRWLPPGPAFLAMSTARKRVFVEETLRSHPNASDREIARMTGTSHPFVGRLRRSKRSL